MCHEWYWRHKLEEREASRRMWDEFERTQPLSEPEVPEEAPEVTLEQDQSTPVAAKD